VYHICALLLCTHLQDNLYSWMSDRLGRDQFVIKAGEETLISWNDGKRGRSEEVGLPGVGEGDGRGPQGRGGLLDSAGSS
jgi:hypothetical protein